MSRKSQDSVEKRMPRVLINCSNLHVGGGVAVATSFLDCLGMLDLEDLEIHVLCSSAVHRNLQVLGTDLSGFASFYIQDFRGLQAFWKGLSKSFTGMDVVFTVFGPAYFLRKTTRHIFGFAQPNIIYPNNLYSRTLPFLDRLSVRARYALQGLFFRRADVLVVELEHVERQLRASWLFRSKSLAIVYSAVHSVFLDPAKWEPVAIPPASGTLKLGIISRNYPHKNIAILPAVKEALLEAHGIDADFYVTFTPAEWAESSSDFRRGVVNVGGLSLSQCPSFYAQMDGVIFPSVLECFSAVPIEAMSMRKPLFASDLPFVHDVCGGFAQVFDPMDAQDIARVVAGYFSKDEATRDQFLDGAFVHAKKFPLPLERALSYLALIRDVLH